MGHLSDASALDFWNKASEAFTKMAIYSGLGETDFFTDHILDCESDLNGSHDSVSFLFAHGSVYYDRGNEYSTFGLTVSPPRRPAI